ncbi:MAG: Ig-like domain-containing protein [Methylococcales bacterium]|nr:Ig-like domain-containing protein [Methylococcales bacterium]
MANITYSALRLEETDEGSFYVADLLLDGDEFYDSDTIELEDGTTAELVVDENDWSKATLRFDAANVAGNIKVSLPDYAFNSGEIPQGAAVTLSVDGGVVEPVAEVTIDTVASDDVIDDQERADGVTITGTAAANAEVTLTFKVVAASDVDLTALEESLTTAQDALTAAQDALTQAQADADQALADANDETLNGVGDAQAALTTAQDDLAASPKDAALQTAVDDAQAALDQANQDAADAVAQVEASNTDSIAAAQADVDAAQAEVDTAQTAVDEAGNTSVTYDEISTANVTADENGVWSYALTDAEYAHTGEVIISAVATDADGKETTAETTITIAKDETAPVVEVTNFDAAAGVITGSIDDAAATIVLTVGGNEREVSVDGDTWTYTLTEEDYQAASFVDGEADGTLGVSVLATDKAGNEGTAEDTLTVPDKVAPVAPEFTSDPENPIIAKTTILYGTAEPNSTVVLTFGEGGIQRTVYADETGQWERKVSKLDLLYLEDDDTQVVTAVSIDAAGNKSGVSTFNPVPDVIALAPTVKLAVDSGDETDAVTNNATLVVTDTEVGATVEFSVADAAGAPTTWSTTQPTAVQGENTILVRQIDARSNISDATEISFTFDNQVEKLALNVAGNAAEGTTLNIAVAQNVLGFNVEPETGATVEYSVNGTDWTQTEPTHVLGLNEGFVRQIDVAGNVSESAKYSFTAVSGPTPVAVAAAGTKDAATGDFAFNVSEGDFTYNIAGFNAGDAIDFPATNNPTVSNLSDSDGIVDLVFANSGTVATLHLTGLTAAQDKAIWSVASFNTVFGANSLTNTGTGAVTPGTTTPTDTTPPTDTTAPTPVAVSAAGTSDVSTGKVQLNFAAGNYAQTVTGFGAGDVLNFPNDVPATVTNLAVDGSVYVEWATNGTVVGVTLTGLTNAQDNAIFDVNSFNSVFGAGSII